MRERDFEAPAQRRSFDAVDLVVGIGLALAIPVVVYFLVQLLGVRTKSDLTAFRSRVDVGTPAPDEEEVRAFLENCRRIYSENAQRFIERSKQAQGFQKTKERNWARICLTQIDAELSGLEGLIRDTQSAERFSAQLAECTRLREQVARDLHIVKPLDSLGREE